MLSVERYDSAFSLRQSTDLANFEPTTRLFSLSPFRIDRTRPVSCICPRRISTRTYRQLVHLRCGSGTRQVDRFQLEDNESRSPQSKGRPCRRREEGSEPKVESVECGFDGESVAVLRAL
jgi:hypothetical protein